MVDIFLGEHLRYKKAMNKYLKLSNYCLILILITMISAAIIMSVVIYFDHEDKDIIGLLVFAIMVILTLIHIKIERKYLEIRREYIEYKGKENESG